MSLKTIKQHNYEHIFVDFDSTIYMWDNSQNRRRWDEDEWNAVQLYRDGRLYDEDNINTILADYLRSKKSEGSTIHLITWTDFSFVAEGKFKFLSENIPGVFDDYIGTSSIESKIKVLKAFVAQGVYRNEILLIDDNCEAVSLCKRAGFDVQEPQTIMMAYLK